jgi:hypothetical protein
MRLFVLVVAILAAMTVRGRALDINVHIDAGERLAYVNMWGAITAGDEKKFQSIILHHVRNGNLIFKVNIFSPGGNVPAAMHIGDQIRVLQARTHSPFKFDNVASGQVDCWFDDTSHGGSPIPQVHKRNTKSGSGPTWCTCASACFLVWASDITREGNYVGIHRPYYEPSFFAGLSPESAKAKYAELQREYRAYLQKLDVPIATIDRLFATDSRSVYFLTRSELQLMQSTPYLEELTQAKCPPDKTKREYHPDGRWKSTTYDPVRINCYRSILKEIMKSGAQKYLEIYGG